MTKFTQIVVALFVVLLLATAVLMVAYGDFSGAVLWVVIAMFFVIVARMTMFEARYVKSESGTQRADLVAQAERSLKRIWKVPGLEGKSYVIFIAALFSILLVQKILVLIQLIRDVFF